MPYLLVHHSVEDYVKWRPIFDEHGATRRAGGSQGGRLFRTLQDPNEIVALFQWDDLEKAKQFAGSEDLREAMMRGGVKGQPQVLFLEELSVLSE